MKRVIVRYKAKPDRAAENIEYIKGVFAALEAGSPQGIRYASFVGEDGVSFVHIASIETDDGSNPLAALEAFKAFQAEIGDRCEIPPEATWLNPEPIGDYGVFG